MQQRELGTSGLHISTIGLGSWAIGGWMWGMQDDSASEAAIQAAVDHGVTWIDTAPIDGGGHSETVVGRAIKALPPSRRPLMPWCAAHQTGVIAYSSLFRGLLFGTWTKDKTFPAGDARGTHKDDSGARFARHLDAVRDITGIAIAGGLSCPQLCIGVLLRTPGLTGCIVGARNAQQGALVASLGVRVTGEQADAVWAMIGRLEQDLAQV